MKEHRPLLAYDKSSAIANTKNSYQGKYKRVLCICSAGILRSPTAALVLSSEPFNFNTRSAGIEEYALIPLTDVLLEWADEIVVMTEDQGEVVRAFTRKPIKCLMIPDSFEYRNQELQEMIKLKYKSLSKNETWFWLTGLC